MQILRHKVYTFSTIKFFKDSFSSIFKPCCVPAKYGKEATFWNMKLIVCRYIKNNKERNYNHNSVSLYKNNEIIINSVSLYKNNEIIINSVSLYKK